VSYLAMRRLKRKTTVELLWPYILKLLQERQMYAYELREQMDKKFGWKPPMVTCYVVLYRLQRGGHVTAEWKEQRGRPARKYYKITKKGKELSEEADGYFKELYGKLVKKS
jgi:PadR family transcriptional regulator PadR